MRRIGSLVPAMTALLLGSTGAAHAQASCELHIFVEPGFAARGHFATFGPGGVNVVGRLTPYEDVEARLREYLAPETQSGIIAAADVPRSLGLTGYEVIAEPIKLLEPPEPGLTIKTWMEKMRHGPRLSASSTPCYAEIRVISQLYEKTALHRMIYSWFVFRQFDGDRILFEHNIAKATQTDAFPPKSEAEVDAARADAIKAFRANLRRFLSSDKFRKLKR
jgi:hypothetical protein